MFKPHPVCVYTSLRWLHRNAKCGVAFCAGSACCKRMWPLQAMDALCRLMSAAFAGSRQLPVQAHANCLGRLMSIAGAGSCQMPVQAHVTCLGKLMLKVVVVVVGVVVVVVLVVVVVVVVVLHHVVAPSLLRASLMPGVNVPFGKEQTNQTHA